MKRILDAFTSQSMRRLGVAVAITAAAAAVAASVVYAERPQGEQLLANNDGIAPLSSSSASPVVQRAHSRSPKDADRLMPGPWAKRPAGRAAHVDDVQGPAKMLPNPSVPDAAEALRDVAVETTLAPTF
jgi:hypothetical protein